jgi:hypothetical protein
MRRAWAEGKSQLVEDHMRTAVRIGIPQILEEVQKVDTRLAHVVNLLI